MNKRALAELGRVFSPMTKREIDERAFAKAMACIGDDSPATCRAFLECYLAALPEPQPARDRIAVVVNAYGGGTADVMPGDPSLFDWGQLEDAAGEFEIEGPFAQNVVTCNLRYYEPSKPIEVDGSVEVVS